MNKKIESKNQKGATLIEYVLLAALIAVVCIVAIRAVGTQGSQAFSRVASAMSAT